MLDASERFDGVRPASLRVPASVIAQSLDAVTGPVRAALTESIARARVGHAAQLPTEKVTEIAAGGTVRSAGSRSGGSGSMCRAVWRCTRPAW